MTSLASGRPLGRDLAASIVVFLVALPLCMGIAIASGAPPALGLLTGIVGGIVVGSLGGAPLQVSGPAAGLTVLVWELIQGYGIGALGIAVLACGAVQVVAGLLHLGRWFRAVSPAVIHGMLAGIGILIVASQFHVMLDHEPSGSGVDNLLSIPEAILRAVDASGTAAHHMAALVGAATILTLVAWNRLRPEPVSAIPGALVGVVVGTALAHLLGVPIKLVQVPDSLGESLNVPALESLRLLKTPEFAGQVLGLAVIASAETLLCATAVDRMHNGPRTKYDRELLAQGVGNAVCGALGALPMTGVIVRSSANVEAGAQTRASAILHGVWLLALVGLAPFLLEAVPTAALAAVLVYTGVRLVDLSAVRRLWVSQRGEALVLVTTALTIAATDLLTGVLVGLVLALAKLVFTFSRLTITTSVRPGDTRQVDVWIAGSATFLSLPKLAEALESIADGATVHLHVGEVAHFDYAALELLRGWEEKHRQKGGQVDLDWRVVEERSRLVQAGGEIASHSSNPIAGGGSGAQSGEARA